MGSPRTLFRSLPLPDLSFQMVTLSLVEPEISSAASHKANPGSSDGRPPCTAPGKPISSFAANAPRSITLISKLALVLPLRLLAFTSAVNFPATWAVPEIIPVAGSMLRPAGNWLAVKEDASSVST